MKRYDIIDIKIMPESALIDELKRRGFTVTRTESVLEESDAVKEILISDPPL